MNARKIGYWVTTGLVTAVFLAGGLFDLARPPQVVEELGHLGYPAYFAAILGAWKLLGALAIAAPGLARLKEWAYAGIVFDLTGAAISHAVVGDGAGKLLPPLVLLVLAGVSWALRPPSRKLESARGTEPNAQPPAVKWAGAQAAG
jgi:uncharacterized membrane protein YphA (DoxX/SURF4 family)